MNKRKKILISIISFIALVVALEQIIFANSIQPEYSIRNQEYSDNFERWLNSSQKDELLLPKLYEVINDTRGSSNLLYDAKLLNASTTSRFTLKDIIPDNVKVKNQKNVNACWAFSTLSSLETNLALKNYKNGINLGRVFDYSERHMKYATSNVFLGNAKNKFGFNRRVGTGGNWYLAESYLTNGSGAINESEMPYEDNANILDISQIQNKNVVTQVYDTVSFPDYAKLPAREREEVINRIKYHIQNYGSVYAGIYGNSNVTTSTEFYNNITGAIYYNDPSYTIDHAVSIIGWDDNYSIENFGANVKPSLPGAWIVRNSWGEEIEYEISDMQESLFREYPDIFIENGMNSPSEISMDILERLGPYMNYTIRNNKIYFNVGDNGYMYVSYEDCNVSTMLYGVVKATDQPDYDYIYQYNELVAESTIICTTDKLYLSNIFDKQSNGKEYLTQVSLTTLEPYICRVFVNPDGNSMARNDLQLVTLKEGETETFDAGYHTIEFDEPIEITGNQFVVVVEIQGVESSDITVNLESINRDIPFFSDVNIENGKCFISTTNDLNTCGWIDLSTLKQLDPTLAEGDSSIKAFTVSEAYDNSLLSIEITNPPDKTAYFEGDNFDTNGMVVIANFNSKNNSRVTLNKSDYQIVNGQNLQLGQTSVTIKYGDKTATQNITVSRRNTNPTQVEISKIEMNQRPGKVRYIQNKENLDLSNGSIKVYYSDNTTEIINLPSNLVTASGFSNKNLGIVRVELEYKSYKTSFEVEIIQDPNANGQEDPNQYTFTSHGTSESNQTNNETDNNEQNNQPEERLENSNFSSAKSTVNSAKYYTYTDNKKTEYLVIDIVINNIEFKNNANATSEYYYYLSQSSGEKNIKDWVKISDFKISGNNLSFKINTKDIKNYSKITNPNQLYLYLKEVKSNSSSEVQRISSAIAVNSSNNIEIYLDDVKKDNTKNTNNSTNTGTEKTATPASSNTNNGSKNSNTGNNNDNNNNDKNTNSSNVGNSNNGNNSNSSSGSSGKTTTAKSSAAVQSAIEESSTQDKTTSDKGLPDTGIKEILVFVLILIGIALLFYAKYVAINRYVK